MEFKIREVLKDLFTNTEIKFQTETTKFKDIIVTITDQSRILQIGIFINSSKKYSSPFIMNSTLVNRAEVNVVMNLLSSIF
jgi:hypothetical protein